jgi:hypothetical protein
MKFPSPTPSSGSEDACGALGCWGYPKLEQPIVSIVLWLREASKLGYAMRVDDQRLASLVA